MLSDSNIVKNTTCLIIHHTLSQQVPMNKNDKNPENTVDTAKLVIVLLWWTLFMGTVILGEFIFFKL